MGEEPPVTDVQQEEDKAKMLLGAKLLVGFLFIIKNILITGMWHES